MRTPAELWIEKAWDALDADRDKEAAEYAIQALTMDPEATDALLVLAITPQIPPIRSALLREAVRIGTAVLKDDLSGSIRDDLIEHLEGHRYIWAVRALAAFLASSDDPIEQTEAQELEASADALDPRDTTGARAHFAAEQDQSLGGHMLYLKSD